MKYYLVQYENGNGYHCNCCRSTWRVDEIQEFESDEVAKEYAEKYNKENNPTRDSVIKAAYPLITPTPIFEE